MNTKTIVVGLGLALLAPACKGFLEEDAKGKLTESTFLKGGQDALDMNLTSLYASVAASQSSSNPCIPQVQGDDITADIVGNKGPYADADVFQATADNKGVSAVWAQNYLIIQKAIRLISFAEASNASDSEKAIAIGQAKYWRAYAYFNLVRLFGEIPLVLDSEDDYYSMPKASVEAVYKQIVQDLVDAEATLPTNYSKEPRKYQGVNVFITKQAVKATLAAVYMNMAGFPLNLGTAYYSLAATKAKEVIDGVNSGTYEYQLLPEYKDIYATATMYHKEAVVGINYQGPNRSWGIQQSQFTSCQVFQSSGGWGDAWGELQFYKDFPEGNGKRKWATYAKKIHNNRPVGGVIPSSELLDFWDGKDVLDANGNVSKAAPKHPMFASLVANANAGALNVQLTTPFDYTKPYYKGHTNNQRHFLIRYSEVLLWYAEATGRSGQSSADAWNALWQVQDRAGVSRTAMGSADDLAEAAYTEHGWEVAGYWFALVTRRADLFRMDRLRATFEARVANAGVSFTKADGSTVVLKELAVPSNTAWSANRIYLPYPAKDAKNTNLVH